MSASPDRFHDANIESLRLPPHNITAEQAVLGALMLDNSAWDRVGDVIGESDFYRADHRQLFRAITRQIDDCKPADVLTLSDVLKRSNTLDDAGGLAYLHQIASATPSAANVRHYAKIVRDHSVLRKMAEIGTVIADQAYNTQGRDAMTLLADAEQRILEVGRVEGRSDSFEKIGTSLAAAMSRLDELHRNPAAVTGIATGFVDIDGLTTGLQPGDLVIVAGRPSMGKTAMSLNIAEHVAVELQLPVVFFSMEMGNTQLAMRMLGSNARVDAQKLRTGRLENPEWDRLGIALGRLNDLPIELDESAALTVAEIRARSRRKWRQYGGLGLIVVDYLQLMQGDGADDNRATEISKITSGLKAMAKELACPVIALSQLNRGLESRPNKRPTMADLRESGSIEQDADLIFFIYRDEVYFEDSPNKGIAEIIIAKQRNGPIGTVPLTFLGHHTRFENYAGSLADIRVGQPAPKRRAALKAEKHDD